MTTAPATPLADGVLAEIDDGRIVLAIPDSDYRLYLQVDSATAAKLPPLESRITGTIHADALRMDVILTGGRYIEPVYGRPRRLQGRILACDSGSNKLTVHVGVPMVVTLTMNQQASNFKLGQMVSFDVKSGTSFTPAVHGDHIGNEISHGTGDPVPFGDSPTDGDQSAAAHAPPGGRIKDAGATGTTRAITGQGKPSGDQPIG